MRPGAFAMAAAGLLLRAALGCAIAAGAAAQLVDAPREQIELSTAVERVVPAAEADGEAAVELVPAETAAPGDEVVFTVTFKNVGAQAADHVRITNPIPSEMRYLARTAFGPGSDELYSVDGGLTFGAPAELTVIADDGTRRTADAADYTHIRWVLESPLPAGATGFARFRAVIR